MFSHYHDHSHLQLESMETHKSVADMAANKFKNMLNRFKADLSVDGSYYYLFM